MWRRKPKSKITSKRRYPNVIVLGAVNVGKTSIINNIFHNDFENDKTYPPTLNQHSYLLEKNIPDQGKIKMTLWDCRF